MGRVAEAPSPEELAALGLYDPADPGATDRLALIDYSVELGATVEELLAADANGTLGGLQLDLVLRDPGPTMPFWDAVERAGLEREDAVRLWRALGFADPDSASVRVTGQQVEALRTLIDAGRNVLGLDATLQLTRVLGTSMMRLAEAIIDSFRVRFEVPLLEQGMPYSEVVKTYSAITAQMYPPFVETLDALLRRHLALSAERLWSVDQEHTAVTREQTVGFADLVDYTQTASGLSAGALAGIINEFESRVADLVMASGGRVVKLIGDEAMFVADDASTACQIGLRLVEAFSSDALLPALRVGLASGLVVSGGGDYYGETVNLAARLVEVTAPSTVIASESVRGQATGFDFEPVAIPPLKGLGEAQAYSVTRA